VLTKISTMLVFLAAQLRCPARRRRNTYDPAIRMQSLGSSLFIITGAQHTWEGTAQQDLTFTNLNND
jgi:hypothetical protein